MPSTILSTSSRERPGVGVTTGVEVEVGAAEVVGGGAAGKDVKSTNGADKIRKEPEQL